MFVKISDKESLCGWALILLLVSACQANIGRLSVSERDIVIKQIRQTLDDYRTAALRQDTGAADANMAFYSKSLVLASDGSIVGGWEEWRAQLRQLVQARDSMVSWEWRNVHVEPLAKDAATATFEFEHTEKSKTGETVGVKGAWTYVFKKEDGRWRIIQSNGTHLPL